MPDYDGTAYDDRRTRLEAISATATNLWQIHLLPELACLEQMNFSSVIAAKRFVLPGGRVAYRDEPNLAFADVVCDGTCPNCRMWSGGMPGSRLRSGRAEAGGAVLPGGQEVMVM